MDPSARQFSINVWQTPSPHDCGMQKPLTQLPLAQTTSLRHGVPLSWFPARQMP